MKVLLDKNKHEPDWETTIESYNPLTLLKLIEKKILAQTEDQNCYAILYDQECALHGCNQHNLANERCYEWFNTNVDVGEAIDITRKHSVLMEDTAQDFKKKLISLVQMKTGSKKGYKVKVPLVHLLRKSGKQHNKLKVDLKNYFATGDYWYPKNTQVTLMILYKYTKYSAIQQTT